MKAQPLPSLHDTDKKRLHAFYHEALLEYGVHDARTLQWVDTFHQMLRFEVLLHVGTFDGKRVLDVGSGLGDFYKFLIKKKIDADYAGVDFMPEFISEAKHKYPEAHFIHGNIMDEHVTGALKKYEYVIASGAMSFKVADYKNFYFAMIKKMYDLSTTAVAFNMLNIQDHVDNEIYAAYDPREVADFCKTFCDRVEIITDYMPQDFTIFLYK